MKPPAKAAMTASGGHHGSSGAVRSRPTAATGPGQRRALGAGAPADQQGVGELGAQDGARGGQAGDQAIGEQRAVQRHHPGERAGQR